MEPSSSAKETAQLIWTTSYSGVGTFGTHLSSFGQTVVSSVHVKIEPLAEGLGDFKGKGQPRSQGSLLPALRSAS